MDRINLIHGDCMELMANTPDKFYDLAIVDPPYGIGVGDMNLGKGGGLYKKIRTYKMGDWDNKTPDNSYFNELIRVSRNQIIWGANHFISKIPFDSSCWIVWDKDNAGTDFADCELAYSSFTSAVRKIKFKWSGILQQDMKNKESRIHPTQKPVKLYQWLLQTYATPYMHILDTHLGSGSSAIAAHYYGCKFTGIEIDADYYNAALKRFNLVTSQQQLF